MKHLCAILTFSVLTFPCAAQQPSKVQQQGSPTQPVKMEMMCRDMATTGNYLAPNETMIGNKACHPVDVQRVGNATSAANPPTVSTDPATAAPAGGVAPVEEHRDIFATSMMPPKNAVDNSIHVYLTDVDTWAARGGWSGKQMPPPVATTGADASGPAAHGAGSDKEAAATAEEMDKFDTEFTRQCPQVMVTGVADRAAFAVTLDHQKKGHFSEQNKIAVLNHNGDTIFGTDTKKLTDSLEGVCSAILKSAGR